MKKISLYVSLAWLAMPIGQAWADAETDARMTQLQHMLEAQQKQMQLLADELKALKAAAMQPVAAKAVEADEQKVLRDQQWKMEAMADEIKALQSARGKSSGQPVYANFKNGLSFEDGSGAWKISLNGRVQADYRSFSPDIAGADTFSVRRARFGTNVTFKDFAARLEGEYSGTNSITNTNANTSDGSVGLTYAHVDYLHFNAFKLRMGQFKPFYGLERAMNTNFTDFQERGVTDALLGNTFDRGLMVFGEPIPGIFYNASITNGKGASLTVNDDEANLIYDKKDKMLRVVGNAAQFAGWKDSVIHLGGFYASGEQEPGSAAPAAFTEARGYTVFQTAAFNTNHAVDRSRKGMELALAHGPVKLQAEYIKDTFKGENNNSHFERDLSAWYASLNWLVTGETFASTYKDGMFGRLRPKQDFAWGGDGWGALQLGARYSKFDGSDFNLNNAAGTGVLSAGRSNEFDAWTLGANWILTPYVRVMANYVHTHFDTPVTATAVISGSSRSRTFDHEDAFTMRAQFDF